ncbi:MAG: hypothetical protein ABI999_05955 [Acidobacteriota bacterium]
MNYYNYFTEIEDTFVRRRAKNLLLSPLDWAMIEGWQDRGIPLHIVLRSIESVFDAFDKKPAQPRAIKSLFYCREEVEAQFLEWANSQTGKSEASASVAGEAGPSKEDIAGFIEGVIQKLSAAVKPDLVEDLERAIARLSELKANLPDDTSTIEPSLFDIEKFLDRSLLTNTDPEHLKLMKMEVSGHLKSYKAGMDAETFKNTFDLMLLKRLREDAGIPRLSLFYL